MADKSAFVRRSREDFHADRLVAEFLNSLLHTTGDSFNSRSSAKGPDVIFKQLGSRGQIAGKFLHFGIRTSRAGLSFGINNRSSDWIACASMARIAGHFTVPLETIFVESK